MKRCRSGIGGWLSPRAVAASVVALVVGLSGCVSNKTSTAPSVGLTNLYFGTSAVNALTYNSGGLVALTFDPATNYFSYTNVDTLSGFLSPLNGSFTTVGGFLDLTLSPASQLQQGGDAAGGYAVTLPGEGLLMRTGSSSTDYYGHSPSPLIVATTSAACPAFSSAETFNFIAQGTPFTGDTTVHVAYGSVEITPSTSGGANTWSFSNYTMFDLSGNALSPAAIPNATCGSTQEGFVLVSPLPATALFPQSITTGVSPSGLLVLNQGQEQDKYGHTEFDNTPTGPTGLMGVLKPSAALNVGDMVGKKYAGFESELTAPLGTIAIAFGTGSGTTITGGGFPKDDVTQTQRTNTTLDLGTQSSQTPGLFPAVTLTQPDTSSTCAGTASGGTDANGNATCVFHGVAVAGQVNGKYVIYTNINDPTALTSKGATPLAVINLALYQQ